MYLLGKSNRPRQPLEYCDEGFFRTERNSGVRDHSRAEPVACSIPWSEERKVNFKGLHKESETQSNSVTNLACRRADRWSRQKLVLAGEIFVVVEYRGLEIQPVYLHVP